MLPKDWGEQQEEDISPTMDNPIVQNIEEGEPSKTQKTSQSLEGEDDHIVIPPTVITPVKLKLKQPSMAIFLTKTKEPALQSSPNDISIENMSKMDGEPAPPASQNSLCKTTKRGRCDVHDCEMTKSKISTQKWRDRGKGRGYGYVTIQKVVYTCSLETRAQKSLINNPEKAVEERNISANSSVKILRGNQTMNLVTDSAGIKARVFRDRKRL